MMRIVALFALLGSALAGPCKPYELPSMYSSYQEMCRQLVREDDSLWHSRFENGAQPEPDAPFPLQGAVLGCLAGRASQAMAGTLGLDVWSGKVLSPWDYTTQSASVTNILISGSSSLKIPDWTHGFSTYTWFNGKITSGAALSASGGSAFVIDYSVPLLENVLNPYAGLVVGTRDEVRAGGPGMVIGRTWAKPFTVLNPTPIAVNQGLTFVLFQLCTADGNYATTPEKRDFTPARTPVLPPPTPRPRPSYFAGYSNVQIASLSDSGSAEQTPTQM